MIAAAQLSKLGIGEEANQLAWCQTTHVLQPSPKMLGQPHHRRLAVVGVDLQGCIHANSKSLHAEGRSERAYGPRHEACLLIAAYHVPMSIATSHAAKASRRKESH